MPRTSPPLAASLALVRTAQQAAALLYHPLRSRILASLRNPDSAANLARRLSLPRQTVNYHVRELAKSRLLLRAGRRRRRQFYEQCYVASAHAYVLSPEILGSLGGDSSVTQDRFSSTFLLGLAGQIQSELGKVSALAQRSGQTIATFSLNATLRFISAAQRAAFADDLERNILGVIARHSSPATKADGSRSEGRPFRLAVGCYPIEEISVSARSPDQTQTEELHS